MESYANPASLTFNSLSSAPPADINYGNEITFDELLGSLINDDDDDDDTRPFHQYYKSEKLLGRLYRAIDERQIWRDDIRRTMTTGGPPVWEQLQIYVQEQCEKIGGVEWQAALHEARGIRQW
jgi:hypothetical protein